ncbi:MAG: hypothetical protein ACLS3U_08360 [Lachnospiraceae bacterium]
MMWVTKKFCASVEDDPDLNTNSIMKLKAPPPFSTKVESVSFVITKL